MRSIDLRTTAGRSRSRRRCQSWRDGVMREWWTVCSGFATSSGRASSRCFLGQRRREAATPSLIGGRNAKPHRRMVEAMLWILRTGAPWRDLPTAYGPWQSVYTRWSRWSASGVLASLLEALARERDGESYLIDATIVRAHQDASGARKKGAPRRSGPRAEVRRRRSTRSWTHSAIRSGSSSRPARPTR